IHHDDLRAGRLLGFEVVVGRVAAAAPDRVCAPEDNLLGVAVIHAVIGIARAARHVDRGLRPGTLRDGSPVFHRATQLAQHRAAAHAREDRFVAMLVKNALGFVCDQVERFVPRDPDPLVTTAQLALAAGAGLPVLALHRILDPVGAENLPALRAATRAATLLRVIGAVFVVVIRLLPDNNTILHQDLIDTAPAAVMPARDGNPFPFRGCSG